MNRLSVILILLLASVNVPLLAQVPQYIKKQPVAAPVHVSSYCYFTPYIDTTRARRAQFMYTDKHFPSSPRRYVKNVYFRYGGPYSVVGTVFDLKVKLGYTQRDTFRRGDLSVGSRDTFITGLTTISSALQRTQNLRDSSRQWMKFELNGPPFILDINEQQNLVVEVSFGRPWIKGYFCLLDSINGGGLQGLYGYRDIAS